MIVRKEEEGIRRYVHLGTGNYNDTTAKLYTDCGLFTCDPQIGEDATAVFNMLSGYSEPLGWNKLSLAPLWLRGKFLRLIQRETRNAKNGKPARIIVKMNSLCDKEIIANLYEASCAGVKIDMIEKLKERLLHILDVQLNDNVKAHFLQPDGTYAKKDKRGKTLVISQEVFCEEALQAAKAREEMTDPVKNRVFIPLEQ